MPSGVPDFPLPVRMVYQNDGSARSSFIAEVTRMTADAKGQFTSAFSEIDQIITRSVSGFKGGNFRLDIDLSSLRQTAAQADFAVQRLTAMRDAAQKLAISTGDTSGATQRYIAALRAQVIEAERSSTAANEQVTTYTRLQGEIDKTAGANARLAQSYRDTYLEQARQANASYAAQQRINNQVSPALAGNRATDNGAGIGALQALAAEQERLNALTSDYATMMGRVKASLDPTIAVQQRFNTQMELLDNALEQGVINTREYAQAQSDLRAQLQQSWTAITTGQEASTTATKRGTTANHLMVNSMHSQRIAGFQLGQQLQDVVVQTQAGTRGITIFTQQVPQMAFALSYLTESQNKALASVGRFGTFLSGPWGAAIFAATALLGPLAYAMLDSGDAADDAKDKVYDFSDGLNVLDLTATQTAAAMKQLADEMRNTILVQGDFLRQRALIAKQSVSEIEGRLGANQAELNKIQSTKGSPLPNFLSFADPLARRERELKASVAADKEALKAAQGAAIDSEIARSQTDVIESLDARTAALGRYNRAIGELNQRRKQSADDPIGAQTSGGFISEKGYKDEFKRLTELKNAELEVAKAADRKPKKTGSSTDKAAREAQRLAAFGDSAADKILRINEAFADQPRLVGRVTVATDQLDDIIKDLENRKPPGFQQMIADAEKAKQVVEDALLRPFRLLEQESARTITLNQLVLSGKDKEAAILEEIYRQQDQLGDLTSEQVDDIIRIVGAREDQLEVERRLIELQGFYLDATRSVRSEVEAILAGQGKISNLKAVFQRLRGQVLAEQLFGGVFRDLDKWVKEKTGIGSSVEKLGKEVDNSSDALRKFVDALLQQTARLSGGAGGSDTSKNPVSGALVTGAAISVAAAAAAAQAANDNGPKSGVDPVTGDIVVVAKKSTPKIVSELTIPEYTQVLQEGLGGGLEKGLTKVLGPEIAKAISPVAAGGIVGLATGGATGGVIGLIKGIDGLPQGIADALGKAGKGASTGTAVAGIAGAFGVNLSNTGAQIGGAIGSFLPIPGGEIIGAIAGGIIGKLIGGTKRGSATIGGTGSTLDVVGTRGNSGSYIGAATGSAEGIIANVERIADAFGAIVDASAGSVSIGIRNGKYRVDPTGSGTTKTRRGAIDFGKDGAEAAAYYATLDLIKDGVIKGLRAGTQKLLQSAKDLDSGLQKAVDFESVFNQLKAIEDPVGAALDTLNKEFTRLKGIFDEAGATTEEYADLEKLYTTKRSDAVAQARQQYAGSLQDLLDELTIGDSGLSLRSRRDAAYAAYTPLASRVQAGDVTAFDDFAQAAQTLLGIERELSGSQAGYFDLFNEIKDLTKATLDKTNALADAAANADTPFGPSSGLTDNASVVDAVDKQTLTLDSTLSAQLSAVNDNLGTMIELLKSNGGTTGLTLQPFSSSF